MKRFLFDCLALCLCYGCASRALVKGALAPEERQEYMEQTGAFIPVNLKQSFINGIVDSGMTKEMVVFLLGQPDRTENETYGIFWMRNGDLNPHVSDMRDSIWNYFGADSTKVKQSLVFHGDTLVRIVGDRSQ